MSSWLQGILLGFIMVLPGVSGGTVFVIFGIYEQLVRDLANFNIRPHLKLFGGIAIGLFLSGSLFSLFFETHRDETVALLLGCLLASLRSVLSRDMKISRKRLGFLGMGATIGFLLGSEPIGIGGMLEEVSYSYLFFGGALASAAMVIPGLPGSSVLLLMGIYDNVLYYLGEFILPPLIVFGIGSLLGMFLLVKLLQKLYDKYRENLSYFFAGLILGSARVLIPVFFTWYLPILFLMGFTIVWVWSKEAA